MSGIVARIARFNKFKTESKPAIFAEHFKLEALLVNLATRLSTHGRPGSIGSLVDI